MTTPAAAALPADEAPDSEPRNKLYLVTRRWHFYAGIYVIPFLIMLPLTGLVMMHRNTIEALQYRELLFVAPGGQPTSAEAQVEAVRRTYPEATVTQ
jgi:uncharacterized iron-regulated membrane protein